jgi:hypothetical protein
MKLIIYGLLKSNKSNTYAFLIGKKYIIEFPTKISKKNNQTNNLRNLFNTDLDKFKKVLIIFLLGAKRSGDWFQQLLAKKQLGL